MLLFLVSLFGDLPVPTVEVGPAWAVAAQQAPADPAQETEDGSEQQDNEKAGDKKPATPPHTGVRALLDGLRLDITHIPTTDNLFFALGGGALALAAHPYDQSFNAHLRSRDTLVNSIYAPAKYYGETPEQLALSLGAYAYGRIFDEPKVSHLGMDLLRAQAITEMLVEPIKYATQRTRPDRSDDLSFPSGHAAITFAGATVLERHLGWKKSAIAYIVAAYVASARMHDNVHYLSDVIFGSALGTIAGRAVTEHGRETWTLVPAPVPGGAAILLMRAP